MSLILNEETRCPWNTISLSFLGHLDFPYSTGNAGIMDVPARRNGAWMRLFAVCRKKDILTGNSSNPERQRRYARAAGLLIGNIVRYIIACNVITSHSGRLGAPP
jgi:hypothetical protein